MKTIEVLYPEFCHLFGESFNVEVLGKCSDQINIVNTNHLEKPLFLQGKADMVYIGACTESKQEMILSVLMPYREEIKKAIENDIVFLATGNALELFGSYILDGDKKIPALDIFPLYAKRLPNGERHNSQFLGYYEGMKILGHKSQFTFSFPINEDEWQPFIHIEKGFGLNPNTMEEGIHVHNFFGTYSLGPFLILNPYFTKHLLNLLGLPEKLCFEDVYVASMEDHWNQLESAYRQNVLHSGH